MILDDATSQIHSAATVMAAVREVIERKELFCALYSDRGSQFWLNTQGRRQGGPASGDAGHCAIWACR